jgi:hypothetical protein
MLSVRVGFACFVKIQKVNNISREQRSKFH